MTDPLDPGRAVGVYVHWPYCSRICPYCDFNVVRDRGREEEQARLVESILDDLSAQARLVNADGPPRELASIFFGGGTPSLLPPRAVAVIIERIHDLFPASSPVEITLEANPTDAEAGRFAALASAGINRLSLGVQSLDDDALRFLGRDHSTGEARRAIVLAAAAFDRLSVDLIYARPNQSTADWEQELRTAVDLGFEHISPYQLTIEPETAFGRAFRRGSLVPPDEDLAADLYEATQTVLGAAGFEAYEVSNHARSMAARSSHNLHVWRGGDYLGVGPGAHGRLTIEGARTATVAHRRINAYVEGVAERSPWSEHERLDARDAAEERLLLGLRTTEGVRTEDLAALDLSERAVPLIEEGFLTDAGGRIGATPAGRPLLDAVLKRLLA